MALKLIGTSGQKKVYLTPYSKWRLELRHLAEQEVLDILGGREITYPPDERGRQKIRAHIGSQEAFLVIEEDTDKIIVITGGRS